MAFFRFNFLVKRERLPRQARDTHTQSERDETERDCVWFSARACDVIRTHHSTDDAMGLFLYLAYQGVHEPRQVRRQTRGGRFRCSKTAPAKTDHLPRQARDKHEEEARTLKRRRRMGGASVSVPQSPEHYYDAYNDSITDLDRRQFAGMLSALDEGIQVRKTHGFCLCVCVCYSVS